jgi:hypothetical protein
MDPTEALDRLHRAGWSVGEICASHSWLVCRTTGENLIKAEGRTQVMAWQGACEQAAAAGMLAAPQPGDDDHEHARAA